jgi:hypothetical protein
MSGDWKEKEEQDTEKMIRITFGRSLGDFIQLLSSESSHQHVVQGLIRPPRPQSVPPAAQQWHPVAAGGSMSWALGQETVQPSWALHRRAACMFHPLLQGGPLALPRQPQLGVLAVN